MFSSGSGRRERRLAAGRAPAAVNTARHGAPTSGSSGDGGLQHIGRVPGGGPAPGERCSMLPRPWARSWAGGDASSVFIESANAVMAPGTPQAPLLCRRRCCLLPAPRAVLHHPNPSFAGGLRSSSLPAAGAVRHQRHWSQRAQWQCRQGVAAAHAQAARGALHGGGAGERGKMPSFLCRPA